MGAFGGTVQASLTAMAEVLPGQAYNPSPADGAVGVDRDVILSWAAGENAVSYIVHFGTLDYLDFGIRFEGFWPQVGNQQTSTEYELDLLAPNTTYFWRVDSVNSNGIRYGKLWRFTTIEGQVGPSKGRACFVAGTGVWINGAFVSISKVGAGCSVGRIDNIPAKNSSLPLPYLGEVQELQEHEGVFECYDVLLQSSNNISVAENHYFLTESGNWVPVQNLKVSTKLQTPNGLIGIVSVTKRATPYTGKVYNLKVGGSDRYLVSKDAVIVRDY
jgi:hypothetical protein